MKQIRYTRGDATQPIGEGPKIIAHICNDIGAWGAGFVLAVSRRWAEPERAYITWGIERPKRFGPFQLGKTQTVEVEKDLYVANMIAQHGIRKNRFNNRPSARYEALENRPPIRYDALEKCLIKLSVFAEYKKASVHMPRIGCGLAGGNWREVEPIIERTLSSANIPVTVYDYGK